jgi:hypothetical protein
MEPNEKCLCIAGSGRVDPSAEPAVHWSEEIASLMALTLLLPKPRGRRAQFKSPRALSLCTGDRLIVTLPRYGLRREPQKGTLSSQLLASSPGGSDHIVPSLGFATDCAPVRG